MSPDDWVGWDDLEEGDGVLLRFQSNFKADTTQTVAGVVSNVVDAHAEVDVDDGSHEYRVVWDGAVQRHEPDGRERLPYGNQARLWALSPVDPVDGIDEEHLTEDDRRASDPLIPPTENKP